MGMGMGTHLTGLQDDELLTLDADRLVLLAAGVHLVVHSLQPLQDVTSQHCKT